MLDQQDIQGGRRHLMLGLISLVILAGLLFRWEPVDSQGRPAETKPAKPRSGEVLALLPAANRDPHLRRAAALRQVDDDPARIMSLAAGYLDRLRREGDSRLGGFAEKLLLRDSISHDTSARLLLADLYQFQHRFAESEQILSGLRPGGLGGSRTWLLSANLARVQGRLADAEVACENATLAGAEFWGAMCSADLALLKGDLPAYRKGLQRIEGLSNSYWRRDSVAATWLGDMADRAGDRQMAEQYFKVALLLGPGPYLVDRYFRFLVDAGQSNAAGRLMNWWSGQSGQASLSGLLNQAQLAALHADRFRLADLSRQFNDLLHAMNGETHWRELVRYELIVTRDYSRALEHAQQNWRFQKEPLDAILYAQAARQAGSDTSLRTLRQDLTDLQMAGVLDELRGRKLL